MMNTTTGKLTILADNTVVGKTEALAESGFSVYLETEQGNMLFDTGGGATVVHNARVLRKDLRRLDRIIISHGHPDHCGGLPEVLAFHDNIDVLAHPDIFLYRYRIGRGGTKRYGGIPHTRGYLERSGAVFSLNRDFVEVGGGVFLSGEIPRETGFEHADLDRRFALRDGREDADTLADDQSLIVNTPGGILIILGCAHAGIINIIEQTLRLTAGQHICCIVGGTHLGFADQLQVSATIDSLKTYDIDRFIPAHCTGVHAAAKLVRELPDLAEFGHVGTTVEF